MWLETQAPLRCGDEVVVCFKPPRRKRELVLFGRVQRLIDGIPSCGVAIEFEALEWFEQKTLADSLRGIPPRFPGQGFQGQRNTVA
jgi:hypothetical protein